MLSDGYSQSQSKPTVECVQCAPPHMLPVRTFCEHSASRQCASRIKPGPGHGTQRNSRATSSPGDAVRHCHPRARAQPMLASQRSRGARLNTMRTTIVHALGELASLHTHPPLACALAPLRSYEAWMLAWWAPGHGGVTVPSAMLNDLDSCGQPPRPGTGRGRDQRPDAPFTLEE